MLPDINYPVVTVVTQYSGASPRDIEDLITKPVEGIVAAVNRVKKVSSITSEGISAVMVEFEWGTNLDYAAQDIRDNLSFIQDFLPEDASDPVIFKFNLGSIPVMFLGVTGDAPPYELQKIIDENVCERLSRLEGVAQAAAYGSDIREIQVRVDPHKLTARNIGMNELINSLRAQNMNLPAGYLVKNQMDFLIRAVGEYKNLDEIKNTVVGASRTGGLIRLKDVAEIADDFKEMRFYADMNGREGLFMIITKRSGANTLLVSRRIWKEIERLKRDVLTEDIKFHEIFDQGRPISKITNSTALNGLIGGILAIIFMFFFLRNIRPTIAIAVAIPFSIITTFIAINIGGYTLNLMTLGGIALGVGMLVDNAVVVIENIYRHLEMGKTRSEAAKAGASEVGMAITASTGTTVAVFLPILFATGLAGQLAKPLAVTIIFALLSSLFIAITIVPMLASVIFKRRSGQKAESWLEPLIHLYSALLARALNHPWRVVLGIVGLIIFTALMGKTIVGAEFMPKSDSPMMLMKMDMPIGTPLEESKAMAAQIRDTLMKYDEIMTIGGMVGRNEQDQGQDAAAITGPHQGQFFMRLKDRKDRKMSSMELTDEIRSRLPKSDSIKFNFTDMHMGGMSSGKPVSIKVFGKDFEVINDICKRIVASIENVEGLRDIEISLSKGRPELHFKIVRDKAIRYGLTAFQVENAIQASTLGQVATRFRTGGEEIDVRVRLAGDSRNSIDELRKIPIKTPTGSLIPLEQICDFTEDIGPTIISRDNQYRLATVDANTADRDLNSIVKDVKEKISGINRTLPSGYFVEFGGEFEDMKDAFITLTQALLVAILLVFMVMAAQFESLTHPFVIMFTMPLAVVGAVWAFIVTGTTLSIVTFIGVIILSGIVVNNGIVLVDYVNQLRRRGYAMRDALIEGGKTRLRPILITAGTTIFGMLPMALSRSEGSEMRGPMALTVIGGLVTATFLTLFLIPIFYVWMDKISARIKIVFKHSIQGEDVAPPAA
jgi:HAE1 family hydrophobic/amphiphilic exporter-1